MPRLALPTVTLCAADTRTPALTLQALQRCLGQADFARCVLFGPAGTPVPAGIELVPIATLRGGADYSRFVRRELPDHIHTGHVLVTQWDGFVLDGGAWRDEFLQHDYIGAVWPEQPAACSVGNGGFSLRSRRFLEAARAPALLAAFAQDHPEDQVLCRDARARLEAEHGVRFAPPALARAFAYENEAPRGASFGFHGAKNLARTLPAAVLREWIEWLPEDFFRGRDARRLARALVLSGQGGNAARLLQRRRAAGRAEPATRLLQLAAGLARWNDAR